MAMQENKDLQASLNVSLSALSISKDVGLADDTSSRLSSFTSLSAAAEIFPHDDLEGGIPLHIGGWYNFAQQISSQTDAANGRDKARSIFEYFLAAASAHGIDGNPCTAMVKEAIAVIDKTSSSTSIAKPSCSREDSTENSSICARPCLQPQRIHASKYSYLQYFRSSLLYLHYVR